MIFPDFLPLDWNKIRHVEAEEGFFFFFLLFVPLKVKNKELDLREEGEPGYLKAPEMPFPKSFIHHFPCKKLGFLVHADLFRMISSPSPRAVSSEKQPLLFPSLLCDSKSSPNPPAVAAGSPGNAFCSRNGFLTGN